MAKSAKATKKPRKCDWLTRAELARAFGLTETGLKKSVLPLVAPSHVRTERCRSGSRLLYYGRGVIEAWAAKQAARHRKPDPLESAAGPAAERYRAAKADMAEMDRDHRLGELVPTALLRECHSVFSSILQRTGDALQRTCGPDAHRIFEEGLDEALAGVKKFLRSFG